MRTLLFIISFVSFTSFSQDNKWEGDKIEVKNGEINNVIISADAIIAVILIIIRTSLLMSLKIGIS